MAAAGCPRRPWRPSPCLVPTGWTSWRGALDRRFSTAPREAAGAATASQGEMQIFHRAQGSGPLCGHAIYAEGLKRPQEKMPEEAGGGAPSPALLLDAFTGNGRLRRCICAAKIRTPRGGGAGHPRRHGGRRPLLHGRRPRDARRLQNSLKKNGRFCQFSGNGPGPESPEPPPSYGVCRSALYYPA